MSGAEAWVSQPETPELEEVQVAPVHNVQFGATAPQLGVPMPATEALLPLRPVQPAWLWVLGCHGGSGERRLVELLPGASAARHAWPVTPGAVSRVLLAARFDARGMQAAQQVLQQWAAGGVPGAQLVGLVLMADAPSRPPKHLREFAQVLRGGVPTLWQMPWIEGWRGSEAPLSTPLPLPAQRVVAELRSLLTTS